jgi:hypothetical protein
MARRRRSRSTNGGLAYPIGSIIFLYLFLKHYSFFANICTRLLAPIEPTGNVAALVAIVVIAVIGALVTRLLSRWGI